jgi:hypothetical protein
MQFVGLRPLKQGTPTAEVERDQLSLDLHNDGELREFSYDYRARTLRLGWTMKVPAWTAPDRPEPSQRAIVAAATLVLSGVRTLQMAGKFVTPVEHEAGGLDFIEYNRLSPGVGELRFVFSDDAEIAVTASRCELLTTGQ